MYLRQLHSLCIPHGKNSIDSINAVSKEFLYSIVHFDNTVVGYGIINKRTVDCNLVHFISINDVLSVFKQ